MEIYITFRLKANSEKDALNKGSKEVQKAIDYIDGVLERMEVQLKEEYPQYPLETNFLDIEAEPWDGEIWQVFTTIQLYLENKFDLSGQYNEYDVWDSLGCPMYQEVQEPLFSLDWSEVEKNCNRETVDIGLFYCFQFDTVKAVDSYHGEKYHFYNNQEWL